MTSVTNGASDGLNVTGNPTTIHCGGPDDNQQVVDTSRTETIHLVTDPSIQVFPISRGTLESLQPGQLASYISTDSGTRVFEITGPASSATAIQETFHP